MLLSLERVVRKLTLFVSRVSWGPSLRPAEILVRSSQGDETRSPIGKGGDFDNRSQKSIDALCFLIIEKFLASKASSNHRIAPKYLPFLKTLYNSKSKDGARWQEDLFGVNPFYEPEQFLERRGSLSTGTAEPYLLSSVEIDVQFIGSPSDLQEEDLPHLIKLAESLAAGNVSNPARLGITIKGTGFNINSAYELGSLSRNDRIQIEINWNFRTYLYVYWVSSEGGVFSLFPSQDLKVGPSKQSEDDKGKRTLLIPENDQFQIKTNPGHETCLVLCSDNSLNPDQQDRLRKIIEDAIAGRDGNALRDHPEFHEFTIS